MWYRVIKREREKERKRENWRTTALSPFFTQCSAWTATSLRSSQRRTYASHTFVTSAARLCEAEGRGSPGGCFPVHVGVAKSWISLASGSSLYFFSLFLFFSFFFAPLAYAVDIPTSLTISICGDGIVNAGELCDDGIAGNVGGYGSSTAERKCEAGCMSFGPYCGDGVLQVRFSEQCDDGGNASGDLCAPQCTELIPTPPNGGGGGSPTVGGTPRLPGSTGSIESVTQTKVVLRGKAYPNSTVNILLDGKALATVRADANADFLYSTTDITPGTASFGFWAKDQNGIDSITTSVIFDVVQSAVTTVANVFLPPTIKLSERQIAPGGLLNVSGETVPQATVTTEIHSGEATVLTSNADVSGKWALQIDTSSLTKGTHTIKASFQLANLVKSGFGRSISFNIGEGGAGELGSPDLNGDGKVNLVDFSIFLTSWNTDDIKSDFNQDGGVNLADFSIMLFNWTG